MTTYDFDAFGNPARGVNDKPRPTAADAAHLYCDGVYDPALSMYYQPIQPHSQPVGLFTKPAKGDSQQKGIASKRG